MFGLGMPEIALVGALMFFMFGAKKLPEIAKGLGRGIKDFKNEVKKIKDTVNVDE